MSNDGVMGNDGEQRDVTAPRFRPDATWECGHSSLGFTCSHGPTSNGKCINDTKSCSHDKTAKPESACSTCALACHKSENIEGAPSPWRECEAIASAPCIPIRSAWSFRRNLSLNLAIGTAGILLCLMIFPQREAAFVPGGLSSKHAQILENRVVSERCSLCHPNSHTLSAKTGTIATQDELCARCHESHLPNLQLRSPHDLERDTLKQLTLVALRSRGVLVDNNPEDSKLVTQSPSDRDSQSVAPQLASLLSWSEAETECASCHIEHHGRKFDLQAITDTRCQACHAKQFASFGNGHPEFDNYPIAKARRIAFTHQAHLEKHFAKKNESFDCSKCHVDSNQKGGVGSVFRTLSFETACARCHNDSINAAAADGWVLLQLPSIKPGDSQQSALGLSGWPSSAQFGYEGTVPLVMRALLMADPNVEGALSQLPVTGEIKSIPNFEEVGRDSTIRIAAGTRALVNDIASGGQAAWRLRLESALTRSLKRELSPREVQLVSDLCAGLPPDVFRQMQHNWFGEGAKGIAANRRQASGDSIPFTQLVSAQDDDLLLSSSDKANDDELLGSPESKDNVQKEQSTAPSADDLLLGKERTRSDSPAARQRLTKLRGAIHVVQGGWYLDNDTLTLRYMPRGHSDPTLAAWSEFAVLLGSANFNDVEESKKHAELAKQVPGGCTQCHELSGQAGSTITESPVDKSLWKALSKPATTRSITKFDHTPHLTLPTLSDCKYCHQLDSTSNARSNFQFTTTNDRKVVDGSLLSACEFKSMHLEQCSACHRPNAASTGCTQCHNYHVTEPKTTLF